MNCFLLISPRSQSEVRDLQKMLLDVPGIVQAHMTAGMVDLVVTITAEQQQLSQTIFDTVASVDGSVITLIDVNGSIDPTIDTVTTAYVLIVTEKERQTEVINNLHGVNLAQVAGPYNIFAIVKTNEFGELCAELVRIGRTPGVLKAHSLIRIG